RPWLGCAVINVVPSASLSATTTWVAVTVARLVTRSRNVGVVDCASDALARRLVSAGWGGAPPGPGAGGGVGVGGGGGGGGAGAVEEGAGLGRRIAGHPHPHAPLGERLELAVAGHGDQREVVAQRRRHGALLDHVGAERQLIGRLALGQERHV